MRPVARAEIAAELALVLARGGAQRHAAEVGAHAKSDEVFGLAFLGAFGERLRIAQGRDIDLLGLGDFLGRQAAHEKRLGAEAVLDRHARLQRGEVDIGGRCRQHVGRGSHLAHQRIDRADRGDPAGAQRGDVDPVAAAYAFFIQHVRIRRCGSTHVSTGIGHFFLPCPWFCLVNSGLPDLPRRDATRPGSVLKLASRRLVPVGGLPIWSQDVSRFRLGGHDTPCLKLDGTAPLPTKDEESNTVLSTLRSDCCKPRNGIVRATR
jgi:hypothetical protein